MKRVFAIYKTSRVGQLSTRISDKSHAKWCQWSENFAYKLTLFRVRRRIGLFTVTVGAMCLGYLHAGYGTNWYTLGYRQGFFQPDDFSTGVMDGFA